MRGSWVPACGLIWLLTNSSTSVGQTKPVVPGNAPVPIQSYELGGPPARTATPYVSLPYGLGYNYSYGNTVGAYTAPGYSSFASYPAPRLNYTSSAFGGYTTPRPMTVQRGFTPTRTAVPMGGAPEIVRGVRVMGTAPMSYGLGESPGIGWRRQAGR